MPKTREALHGELSAIDAKILPLLRERDTIVRQLQDLNDVDEATDLADKFFEVVKQAPVSLHEGISTLAYVNKHIVLWRHRLPIAFFPQTLQAIGENLPSSWTVQQGAKYMHALATALMNDFHESIMKSGHT